MKTISILSSVKSRYFMLVACVTLLSGVTACSSEEFGAEVPEIQKKWTKQELIEQALSRMPQTRANEPAPVVMTATAKSIYVRCLATENVIIHWDDEGVTEIIKGDNRAHQYTFSSDKPSYWISLETSQEAIKELDVFGNELDYLNIENNVNLEELYCNYNNLDKLKFDGCQNLKKIDASLNNITTIDLTPLSNLEDLNLIYNGMTNIDVSTNLNLHTLRIDENPIERLDISKNTQLQTLYIGLTSITNLDLTHNIHLRDLSLYYLHIDIINNQRINAKSFSNLTELEELDITGTPFISLNLDSNPLVHSINISETQIRNLDVSKLKIDYLNAINSNLENIEYADSSLDYLCHLYIEYTPFEKKEDNEIRDFLSNALPNRVRIPNRNGDIVQGYIRTKSPTIINANSYLKLKNWIAY